MGYYTCYELKIEPQDWNGLLPQCEHSISEEANFCPECGKQVRDVKVNDLIWEIIMEDSDDAMTGLSERFPRVLFTLSGEGEESGDIWKRYYLGGKCQVAKARIVIDEFDPEKLK